MYSKRQQIPVVHYNHYERVKAMKKDIRAIIFDIGGVLTPGLSGVENLLQSKTSVPAEEFVTNLKRCTIYFLNLMRETPGFKYEEWLNLLARGSNWGIDPWYLHEIFMHHILSPYENSALGIVRELHELNGFDLYILSDNIREWCDYTKSTKYGKQMLSYFDKAYYAVDMPGNPDFCALAQAYGIPAARLTERAAMREALKAWLATKGPALLECVLDSGDMVFPSIVAGKMMSKGFVVNAAGGNTLRFAPPYTITEAEIDAMATALNDVFAATNI